MITPESEDDEEWCNIKALKSSSNSEFRNFTKVLYRERR